MISGIAKMILCVSCVIMPVLPGNKDINAGKIDKITNVPDTNPYVGGYYNCTWTAWNAAYEAGYRLPGWHNAGVWAIEAALQGFMVTDVPAENSIAVWSNHVAFVNDVRDDGTVCVEEGGASIGHRFTEIKRAESLYNMPFIGYIYLPITKLPDEEVKPLPLMPLYEKAENVNIQIDISQIADRQIEVSAEAKKEKMLLEDRQNVKYVEQMPADHVKSDEPDFPAINKYLALPKM